MRKLLLTLLLLVPMLASAYDAKIDGVYYKLNVVGKTAEVTNETGGWNAKSYSGSVTIPSSIMYDGTTYTVTSIGAGAFSRCTGLTSITIPESVTSIGGYAITVTNGGHTTTITIGDGAFSGCSGLTSILVENGNKVYDSREGCNAIIESSTNRLMVGCVNTIIPTSVTSIGEEAFRSCTGLTSITIPTSVTSIGNSAFQSCSGLTSITIPESVTSIESNAFSWCSGLTSILVEIGNKVYDSREGCNAIIESSTNRLVVGCVNTIIPESVTSIGEEAFERCSGLTSITIPESVTSIGNSAFSMCSGLTSVVIPKSVTSIGNSAFVGCSGLTSVVIPKSVTSIGDYAFEGCSGLTNLTIGSGVKNIGWHAFGYCENLEIVTCLAEEVHSTYSDAFWNVNVKNATLRVPEQSVAAYSVAEPWSHFGKIEAITIDEGNEEIAQLKAEIETLKAQNDALITSVANLSVTNNTLTQEVENLKAEIKDCDQELALLRLGDLNQDGRTDIEDVVVLISLREYSSDSDALATLTDANTITTAEIAERWGDVEYYTLDGKKVGEPNKQGIYLVKKDGKTKMVVVKK